MVRQSAPRDSPHQGCSPYIAAVFSEDCSISYCNVIRMTQIQATVYCSIRTELKPIFSGHPVQRKSEKQPAKRCPCFCVLPEPEQKANIMPEQYIQQERGVFTPPQAVVVFAEFTSFHCSLSPFSAFYQPIYSPAPSKLHR